MLSSSQLSDEESNGFRSPRSRRKRVAELTQECLELEQRLEDTKVALARKRQKRARLAPVYSLPDDLWCHIFTIIYAHQFPHCYRYTFDSEDSLMPLARVSRYFRHVALSLPSLWTCIYITPPSDYRKQHYPERVALLKTQLVRSQDLPITILFCCHQPPSCPYGWGDFEDSSLTYTWDKFRRTHAFTHFQECWKALVEHSSRWRRLALFFEHPEMFTEIWDMLKSEDRQLPKLPLLESLDIMTDPHRETWMQHPVDVHTLPTATPLLTCLRVHGLALSDENRAADLPALPLTELALVSCSVDLRNFGTLPLSRTLTTLALRDIFSIRLPATNAPLVEFPCLKIVFFEDIASSDETSGHLLSFLLVRAPRLQHIEFAGNFETDRIFSFVLSAHSFPAVHTIVFRSCFRSPESGLYPPECPFLDPFPGLRRLYILLDTCYPYVNTLLQRSRASFPQSPCPWQQLEQLTVSYDEERDEDKDEVDWVPYLLAFVRFRQQVGLPLRSIGLIPDPWSEQHKPGVADSLEKLGVTVDEWCSTPILMAEASRWSPDERGCVHPEWIFDIEQRYDEGIWY